MHDRWQELTASADRYDSLAGTADLMGDTAGAERFRAIANERRMQAMLLLDQLDETAD